MKFLIIEDDDDLRALLENAMRDDGHLVESERSGADGLSRAVYQDFDLIILDVMLPELDGWQVLQRLRERKSTPVLLLTSIDSPADRVRGLDLGSDDYIPKPFDISELKARIRAIIRRKTGDRSKLIDIIPGFQMDSVSRWVLHDGERVEMTARELNLLELFLQRRGSIISKDQIRELLFEDCEDGESNVVEVYIYGLRKKFGRSTIKTHRGLGYELVRA
ncbi:MAG: response regulator transcription factor [Verrucomicrobiota bacterium]